MKHHTYALLILLVVACLPGCATVSGGAGGGAARPERGPDERAIWHYANGLYAQRRNDPGRALAEFQQAARFDPRSAALHNRLAYHYYIEGMDHKTIEELRKALEADPANVEVRSTLASLYASQGDYSKAQREYLKILSVDPKNEEARYYLAGVLAAQNKNEEAVETYRTILKKNPRSATAHYDMGLVYTKRGDVKKAEQAFRRAIELDPTFESAYTSLGLLYELNQKRDEAVGVYEALTKVNPSNPQPFMALGEIRYNAREYAASLEAFEKYRALKPGDVMVLDYIGLSALHLKRYDRAVEAFEELEKAQPNNQLVKYRLAAAYEEGGSSKKAEAALRKIIAKDPRESDAWIRLLFLLDAQKRKKELERTLVKAREAVPDDADMDMIQGMLYHRNEEYEKAEQEYRNALSKDPANPAGHFNLGVVLDKRGDFEGAIGEMQRTLELEPNYAEALNYIGYSYAEKGIRLKESLRFLEKALALEPENAYFLDSLAWALYRKGDICGAWREMEKALALLTTSRKEDAVLYDHAAEIRLKLKDPEGAALYWKKATELDPLNEDYRLKREAVEP